jgi:hypothetical protein
MAREKKVPDKKALRIIAATILGAVAGIACWQLGKSSGKVTFDTAMILGTIANRTLLGFVIGISGLKRLNYLLHGVIIGLIATIPMSVYPLAGGDLASFVWLELAGAVYGLVIELVVTKLLKAPMA